MSQLALKFFLQSCQIYKITAVPKCQINRFKKFQTDRIRIENFQNGLGRIEGGNRWIDGLIRIDSKRVTALTTLQFTVSIQLHLIMTC